VTDVVTVIDPASVRFQVENGLATRVAAIAEPIIESFGFALVKARVLPLNGCTVQILVENPNGAICVADCETISQNLSPALDVADLFGGAHYLEVSSPGIDRPLVRPRDFTRWQGMEAKIEMETPPEGQLDGRKRFRGFLKGYEGDFALLQVPEQEDLVKLRFADIVEARLMMTDALIRESLKAGKKKEEETLIS
jgi:ribosome maturation factor RimP